VPTLSLKFFCLAIALILFFVGAFWSPSPRFSLISAGLFFWLSGEAFGG
jgi:hypothetical protein